MTRVKVLMNPMHGGQIIEAESDWYVRMGWPMTADANGRVCRAAPGDAVIGVSLSENVPVGCLGIWHEETIKPCNECARWVSCPDYRKNLRPDVCGDQVPGCLFVYDGEPV